MCFHRQFISEWFFSIRLTIHLIAESLREAPLLLADKHQQLQLFLRNGLQFLLAVDGRMTGDLGANGFDVIGADRLSLVAP